METFKMSLRGILGGSVNDYREYGPSETVPKSGIYDVVHKSPHSVSDHHQVTCVKGNKFPPCRDCKDGVKFKLHQAAYHLSEHPHLLREFGS
jgi:hypothetical protein